jgi:hypothetical protein
MVLLILLTLHVIGLVLMSGTTIIDYLTYQTFWKLYMLEKVVPKNLIQLMSRFSRLIGIGAALLILTGFSMMFATHGVFGSMTWFRIKFVLVILLVLNGVLVGRRLGSRLHKQASEINFTYTESVSRLKSNMNRFYLLQLSIFLVIIFLSIFKFN